MHGEDPVSAVNQLADRAVMVHIKDFHVKPHDLAPFFPASGWFRTAGDLALRGAILGHGQINIPSQLLALKAAGYSGYLSLGIRGHRAAHGCDPFRPGLPVPGVGTPQPASGVTDQMLSGRFFGPARFTRRSRQIR